MNADSVQRICAKARKESRAPAPDAAGRIRIAPRRVASLPREPSPRALEVAAMFGLGIDDADAHAITVVPEIHLEIRPGEIIFITGPSGGGKSTLLRCIREAIETDDSCGGRMLIDARDIELPENSTVIDVLDDLPLEEAMAILSRCGLSEAFVLLRSVCELSDGERARLTLAAACAAAERSAHGAVILVDEFCAPLDRLTAHSIARCMRRWTSRSRKHTLIAAAAHDDTLETLDPDVLILKLHGERAHVLRKPR